MDWWHGLQGGAIAQSRPPPPGADAAYPNLSTVPGRPQRSDPAVRATIAGGLVADRANAQYAASLAPLPTGPLPRPAATPAPPADDTASSASLPAAEAPPPKRPPPRPRPVPADSAIAPASGAAAVPAPREAAPVDLPTLPAGPPSPPNLEGVAVPPTAPTPAPPTPPPVPAPARVGPGTAIAFAPGSAELPSTALGPLKALAQQRGTAPVRVTGFGEASSADPSAQQAALPLALARARAIAASLMAAGIPGRDLRIAAEATGAGGEAQVGGK